MYLVKYETLKEKLRTRTLSEREALPYFLLQTVLVTLLGAFNIMTPFNTWDSISALLSVSICLGGIIYAYDQNGGASGYDFIQKFIVLSWVVAIRLALIVVPLFFVIYFIGDLQGIVSLDETNLFDVVIQAAVEICFFQRVSRHIRDTVASTKISPA